LVFNRGEKNHWGGKKVWGGVIFDKKRIATKRRKTKKGGRPTRAKERLKEGNQAFCNWGKQKSHGNVFGRML